MAPRGRDLYVSRWSEEIRIVDIALLPDACNPGIGTTLLLQLRAEAQASGKPRLRSSRYGGQAAPHPRRALNPALRLYERLGFRQIEDKGVYLFLEWRHDNSQSPTPNFQGTAFETSG